MGIGLDCDMGYRKDSCIISKNLILLFFLGITNVNCLSQDNSFKFRRLTIEDGLSQSSVQSIAQDKEGYIWLATANGLNRYDGYEFKIFKNEIDNDSSLSNNRVEKIFIDSENRLWVGTAGGGLNLFNNKSGSFRRITLAPERSLSIKAIYESQDGMLWIGSGDGRLFKIDQHADDSFSTTSYHIIPDSLSAGYDINDITIYDNKLILGTARKGIIYFDPENEKFSEYYHTPYKHLLRNCFVNDFYIDKQHNLWVATDDEGMFVFQGGFETATHIDYENFWVDGLLCNNIYDLAEDQHGFLWVGTKGGGERFGNED